MEQQQEQFQKRLEIGHTAEDLVSKVLINAGYKVYDIGSHRLPAKHPYMSILHNDGYLYVDKYVIGEHKFWLEVKARMLTKHYLTGRPMSVCWVYTFDMEWLVNWHIKTGIPPFIVFALYEDVVENSTFHIISVYRAKNKGSVAGKAYIGIRDMMPLGDWLVKIKEYPDKWRAII